MLKTLFLICPLLVVWAFIGFFSYGNYSANQYVDSLGEKVNVETIDSAVDVISPLYSDAVYFATEKYEDAVNELLSIEAVNAKEANEKVEALYSEVAWFRPLSPSSWINLSNWSAENEFIQNASYYLSTALLLLQNKPTAAWELIDLSHSLSEKELSINIAGQYLQQNPTEISFVMDRFSEPSMFEGDLVNDVVLSSFFNKTIKETEELMSKYVLNTNIETIEFSKYLFELIEINNFDINKAAANRLKSYFNESKDFVFLNRLNSFFSKKKNLALTIDSNNTNNKGQLCWNISNSAEKFQWKHIDQGGIELTFDGVNNINFNHLSCGFFLNERKYNTDNNSNVSVEFSLAGENITSSSGFYSEIYQPEVGRLAKSGKFTGSWKERIKLNFNVQDYEKPIYFKLRRDKSSDLNNLLSGKVVLSDFSINSESGK